MEQKHPIQCHFHVSSTVDASVHMARQPACTLPETRHGVLYASRRGVKWRGIGGEFEVVTWEQVIWGRWERSQPLLVPRPLEHFAVILQV